MAEYLIGAAGMLLTLAAFAGGVFFGRSLIGKHCRIPAPAEDAEESAEKLQADKKRMKEETEAFRLLQNYNASVAYKMESDREGDLI
ncbi:MAG: hypothetical protein PUJ93_04500 [Oscillospiraceae bacterium]|nr:hypothetical protein [Oscillospiraceae bacterium]MDY5735303.1 hypothetical protein [Oscillospiraceae bacterium]